MTAAQQQQAAKKFAAYWKDKGYEKGESQSFWLSLLRDVYGVERPEQFITFEEQVHLDHTSFIDGAIPSTKVLIEQKGLGKDLNKPIKQSDGTMLTPFQQAKRYITELPLSQHPRWVVTCNFAQFYVYDMERPGGEPEIIELANLEKEYYRLQFLVDTGSEHLKREMEVSIAAGEIVGLLYDALYKQYKQRKELLSQIEARLALIARQGRAFGIHLLLATQRPDANILSGQVKNNMNIRICGRADTTLSTIIIGDGRAAEQIPQDAQGRFLMEDGTIFQGYYFDGETILK